MPQFTFAKRQARPAFTLVVPEPATVVQKMMEQEKSELLTWILRGAIASNCDLAALSDLPNKVLSAEQVIAELEQAQATSSSIISAATFALYWPEISEQLEQQFGKEKLPLIRETLELACGHNGKNKLLETQVNSILRNFESKIADHEIFAVAVCAARTRREQMQKLGEF